MATQPSTAPTQSPRLGTTAKPLDPSAIPVQKQDFKNTGNTPDQLLLYFARTPLEQISPRPTTGTIRLWKDFDIVGFQLNERVPRVFAKLVTEGFLSGTVLDQNKRYVDYVDMLDLVMFTVDLFTSSGTEAAEGSWTKLMANEQKFQQATISEVLEHARGKRVRATPVYRGVSLLQALEIFANTDIHRVPVLNRNHRVVGMVTQSMVISLMTQNINLLGDLKDVKVSEMEPKLNKELLSVREDQKAIDAFRLMAEKGVSGLAVVDSNGLLTDTISIRELRGIGTDATRWDRLYWSIRQFKTSARQDYPTQTPREVLYVTPQDTIQKVIQLFDDGNIHRVFEVESVSGEAAGQKLKPKHVITQGDLLRFIVAKTRLLPEFGEQKAGEEDIFGTAGMVGGDTSASTSSGSTGTQASTPSEKKAGETGRESMDTSADAGAAPGGRQRKDSSVMDTSAEP
jgi:CBS domain-containing protein